MIRRFFAYSHDGFTLHDTAEEAKAEAERLLNIERDLAISEGEWSEDACVIMWGEVKQRVEERCVDHDGNDGWHVEMTLEDIQ